jgi:hypothetical protein
LSIDRQPPIPARARSRAVGGEFGDSPPAILSSLATSQQPCNPQKSWLSEADLYGIMRSGNLNAETRPNLTLILHLNLNPSTTASHRHPTIEIEKRGEEQVSVHVTCHPYPPMYRVCTEKTLVHGTRYMGPATSSPIASSASPPILHPASRRGIMGVSLRGLRDPGSQARLGEPLARETASAS